MELSSLISKSKFCRRLSSSLLLVANSNRFVNSSWSEHEYELCLTLLRLNQTGCITSEAAKPGYVACPSAWKSRMKDTLSQPSPDVTEVSLMNTYSKLPKAISLFTDPSLQPDLVRSLHGHLSRALADDESELSATTKFFIGQGFKSYVELASQSDDLDSSLWDAMKAVATKYSRLPPFLEAVLNYILTCSKATNLKVSIPDDFANALITNLAGPSQQLRLLSLKILQQLLQAAGEDASPISLAVEVEESPLTIQTARVMSMQIRKLVILYPQIASRRWMATLIPHFSFGLFSKKLAPLWDDAAAALKTISEHPEGEKIVSDIAIRWLHERGSEAQDDELDDEDDVNPREFGEYQCFNAAKVEKVLDANFRRTEQVATLLEQALEKEHSFAEILPIFPRAHALRALNAAPIIAEKRSRQVVPLFLSWALHDEEDTAHLDPESNSDMPANEGYVPWSFKDRLAFLALLGQFINPVVLYKASEVHDALLGLLCHGNSEIQRSALKALFTWKSPNIVPYQENLLNILDESRFRDELSAFVHVGRDDSIIKEAHRPELLPVLLRLLYGRMISKASVNTGQAGQAGRRKAILRTLSHLPNQYFELFMQVSFGPLGEVRLVKDRRVDPQPFQEELASLRRQMGLLKLIETVFDTLQTRVGPFAESSMNVVLYCLVKACRVLEKGQSTSAADFQEEKKLSVFRNVRYICIRCLELIFSVSLDRDWTPYVQIIYEEVINPRLENFATETAQGVSGLLRLFHTWASSARSSFYLVQHNNLALTKIVDCLGVDSARDAVKIFVMDEILVPVIGHSSGKMLEEEEEMSDFAPQEIRSEVLSPYIEHTLSHLGRLLKRGPSRPVLGSGVQTLSLLAPCVESSSETSSLISITTYLLRQPPDRVTPKTKSGLMNILEHFLPLYSPHEDPELSRSVYEAVSSMFDYFKDDANREVLSRVFSAFAKHDPELGEVAELCADLNSRSMKKLEVDYERRLQAFRKINDSLWENLNFKQWRPLLCNMLFHVKDEEELAIRSSASFGLRRFMDKAIPSADAGSQDFEALVSNTLFPALQTGVRQRSELIRSEFVIALGYFVKLNPNRPTVQDLHALLVGDDEEASFFNNILHIQQHRRLRALRRLANEAAKGGIQATNISTIFIPLIEHFVFDQEPDENAHNLIAEAVTTLGALGESLDWNQFRNTFRRYRGYMESKSEMERNVLRLLGRMSDALTNAMRQRKTPERESEDEMANDDDTPAPAKCNLAQTIPSSSKVASELTSNFTPFLTNFIHWKNEAEMSLRLPAAVTCIKLLKLLPEYDMAIRLPPVLLDVCSILKSKAQDSRDTARKTLNEIALLLGPVYFGYILKELRNTLMRGYQLHVLSFTVHSILVATTDEFKQGDLDYCLGDLVSVVMDDVFGAVAQEKEAEEYTNKMKEVKSSKSFDSMELLAKNSTVGNLSSLVRPLQALLQEKLNSGMVRKIDELLRRIGIGLLRNPGAESRDLLMFCYEVIKESYREPVSNEATDGPSASEEHLLIKYDGAKRGEQRGSTSSYLYKLKRFALDVLRSILNKYGSLLTPANMAGFLPIIGDALVQEHEEVKISALRLLSRIIKLPLSEIDNNSHVYLTEAVKIIKEAPSTNTEASQAALKLISAMLRERKNTKLRDGHLAYLLQRLTSDIEEPDRQGVTFNFIRAVMARKFVVPEMYELADRIATMMVTNQTRAARDLARGVYIHFLIEYPQAKNRWAKQLSFLAKNFEYKHADGRQSVMEAVHMLLSKTGPELAQDIVGTFFLPLVIVMANDDAPECREMAGALLGELYSRADKEHMKTILTPLRSWFEQTDNMVLCSTGLQAMRIYFEVEETEKEKEARFVTGILQDIMEPILQDETNENWETLYFSLQLFTKLSKAVPSITLAKQCATIWTAIRECLFYPHAWIKTCAANLVGMWLADLAKTNAVNGYGSIPLVGSAGLALGRDAMLQLIRASMRCLRAPGVGEELAMQTVRNIVFLCRCAAQNNLEFTNLGTKDAELDEIESEEEDADVDADEVKTKTKTNGNDSTKSVIRYIFEQASSILRREFVTTRAESLIPKTASIGLFAALCRHLDAEQIYPSLRVILLPLQHLTDSSIPGPRSSDVDFQNAYKSLVSNCHEVLDLIQKKLGTTEYITQMALVQDSIRERREGRRVKRRIEAVTEPEKYGQDKRRKNDRKREKKREKGLEFRGKRRGW